MDKARQSSLQEMSQTFNQLKRAMQVYVGQHADEIGLSPALLHMLKMIHCEEPISHKALASQMQLTPGAVSQSIEALDEAGLIVRTASQSDRRVSYVSINQAGKQLLARHDAFRLELLTKALSDVSDGDIHTYVAVQKILTQWLEANSTK